MATGTIVRMTEKGFGFVRDTKTGVELFFHRSAVQGARFEDLEEGTEVTFEEAASPKGPRAERVTRK